GQGGYTEAWSTFATVDAFVLKQSGKEEFKQGRVLSDDMYRFHVSYLTGLNNKMKITHNSEDYQIRAVNDIASSNQWMIIDAERGVAQ
ncbi:MAG: phage head closure protein, partial [Gammaproteobacteria bacterium]|nr:phage head closure protein [Gammaproteobacteria bacterium]